MLSKSCFELVLVPPQENDVVVFTSIRVHDLRSAKMLREMIRVRMFGWLSKGSYFLVPVRDLPQRDTYKTVKGYGGLYGVWLSADKLASELLTEDGFVEAWSLKRVLRDFGVDLA